MPRRNNRELRTGTSKVCIDTLVEKWHRVNAADQDGVMECAPLGHDDGRATVGIVNLPRP
jgi:hypothetical protein